jgi:uncharacterized membrane protein SirB2
MIEYYPTIKTIHFACAMLSVSGFFIRGIWMLTNNPLLSRRITKILPHCVDTVLLTTAIMLAIKLQQYPLSANWLTAKVVALLVYIGLGFIALRFGKTRNQRLAAWLAALIVFGYIVLVAIYKHPMPFT